MADCEEGEIVGLTETWQSAEIQFASGESFHFPFNTFVVLQGEAGEPTDEVYVSGCGDERFNGTYKPDGEQDGVAHFSWCLRVRQCSLFSARLEANRGFSHSHENTEYQPKPKALC